MNTKKARQRTVGASRSHKRVVSSGRHKASRRLRVEAADNQILTQLVVQTRIRPWSYTRRTTSVLWARDGGGGEAQPAKPLWNGASSNYTQNKIVCVPSHGAAWRENGGPTTVALEVPPTIYIFNTLSAIIDVNLCAPRADLGREISSSHSNVGPDWSCITSDALDGLATY
ncbi:hypothetical protein EVAR_18005_1 [Eumeta japonica]|uniref:Uncharacterized protein n=1 Tax=Eumeta variegata TaxID=151549 RepID=A0A4C1Y8N3_EUMVA|nr:hypothetical protein EVAR_18005_1 [Eumeta japonica]